MDSVAMLQLLFEGVERSIVQNCKLYSDSYVLQYIGIGAGSAGPILVRPLFWRCNKIHKIAGGLCTHLLQPDHFESPSYAPAVYSIYTVKFTLLKELRTSIAIYSHALLRIHVIGGKRSVRIATPCLLITALQQPGTSILVEALLQRCHLDAQGLLH